ncbi:AraC family transcriptional regulator [Apibacter sp. HY039]|uniref:helix-turn-helix domain-containing protein n=1 Tax=Apibacter sp. HY039 TaxID=2501476 RepID=UPI000FEC1E5B|nr:AraC family transcriptional regulator [Apibacter sp. HY039]
MLKKFSQNFLLTIIFTLFSVSILYYVLDIKLLFIISLFGLAINLICFAIIFRLNENSIKLLIDLYVLVITSYLFLHALILLYNDVTDIFLWYMTIPLALSVVFSYKKAVILSICILTVTFISVTLLNYSKIAQPILPIFTYSQKNIIKAFTLIGAFNLVLFSTYYIWIKQQMLSPNNSSKEDTNKKNTSEEQRYKNIYTEILIYLKEKEPWKNPDFNISELATLLNTNPSYVSRAINMESDYNFNTLINLFRINYIKEELNRNTNNKYTLMYIYSSAGFKHQSTFNKAFKQIEGITPTQYIQLIQYNE